MKLNVHFVILIISIFLSISTYPQKTETDSLINLANSYPNDDTTKVNLLNKAAKEIYNEDVNQTFNLATESKNIAEKLGFTKGLSEAYRLLGTYYFFTLNYQEAEKTLNKSIKLCEQEQDLRGKARALGNLGAVYTHFRADSFQIVINVYNQAIELFDKINDSSGKSIMYINLGLVYYMQGDLIRAIETQNEALNIQVDLKNDLSIALCYNNLGILYHEFGDIELALKNFMHACSNFEKAQSNVHLVDCYGNIGDVLFGMGKEDEALTYYKKSLELGKQLGVSRQLSTILISIGELYKKQGHYQLALNNFRQAGAINDSLNFKEGILNVAKYFGETYFELGQYNEAINHASKALKMAVEYHDLKVQKDVNELLSKIYESQNHPSLALKYYKEYKVLQDSLINESNIKEAARLESKYENEKEKQALRLEQERKEALFEEEAKQQKIIRNVFIAGFLSMLALAFVIFRYFLQKRKANKMLALQKEEITSQAKQLKITNEKLVELDQFKQGVTSMIVHDLKNPLNTIINVADNELTRQAAGQMLNLVLNILDVNKYENTQMVITKARLPIFKNLQKAIEQVTFFVERKKILIENKIDKTYWVEGDPVIVERIFVNLLSNAVKYTPVNGNIEVSGDIDEKNGNVVISVKDTGKGIPKEYHNKVFEKFAQIDAKNTGNLSSTGLGLTFCKIAVEAHGGKIWIDNSYSEGTCVSFILPVSYVSQEIIDERIIASNSNQLTKQESQVLQKYLPQFLNLEFYEITAFRKLFHEIEKEGKVNSGWLQELKDAVDYENRIQFENLINSHI